MSNTRVKLFLTSSFTKPSSKCTKILLLLDNLKVLDAAPNSSSSLGQLLQLESEEQWTLIKRVASSLKPSADFGCSAECHMVDSDGLLRTIVIACLSTACSRHNSPSRCHSINSAVNKLGVGLDDALIVLVPQSREHIMAQFCAVGRCFLPFNMKTSKAVPKSNVVMVTACTLAITDEIDQHFLDVAQHTIDGIR